MAKHTCPVRQTDEQKKAWDNLVKLVGGLDNAYKAYAYFGNNIPTEEELIASGRFDVDNLRPRSYYLVQNLTRQLGDIQTRIKAVTSELKKSMKQGEGYGSLAQSKLNALKEESRSIGGLRKRAMKEATIDRLISLGYVERRKVENILNKSEYTLDDLNQVLTICNFWIEACHLDENATDHIIFNAQDLADLRNENLFLKQQRAKLDKLSTSDIYVNRDGETIEKIGFNKLREKALAKINEKLKESTAKFTGENAEWETAMKDINGIAAYTMALGFNNHPAIRAYTSLIAEADKMALMDVTRGRDEIIDKWKDYTKAEIKQFHDLAKQRRSNEKDQLTGDVTSRYTQEYNDTIRELRAKRRAMVDLSGDEDAQRQSEAESYKWYFDEVRKHSDVMDVRYIFDDKTLQNLITGYESGLTEEQRIEWNKKMIAKLGKMGFEKELNEAKKRFQDAMIMRSSYQQQQIDLLGIENQEAIAEKMKWWDATYSPIKISEYFENGFPVGKVGGAWVNAPDFSNVTTIAKNDKDYDNNFKKIEASKRFRDLYDYYIDGMTEGLSLMPQDQVGMFQSNRMVKMPLTLMDEFAKAGMVNSLGAFFKKSYESITQSNLNEVINDIGKNPDGSDALKLRVVLRTSFEEQVKEELNARKAEYQIKNGEIASDEQVREWRWEITDKLAREHTFDMQASMLMTNLASKTYKYKARVEPQIRALRNIIKQLREYDENIAGTITKELKGKQNTKQGLKHLQDVVEYNNRLFYGYPVKKENRISGKQLTAEEKKDKARYEKIIEGFEKQYKAGTILSKEEIEKRKEEYFKENGKQPTENEVAEWQKMEFAEKEAFWLRKIDEMGHYVIAQKVVRKTMKWAHVTTFAWNPIPATSNLIQGFFDNSTEAAGGLYYNKKDYTWAVGKMLGARLNFNGKEAKKIVNVMKKLCVFSTRRDELSPSGSATLKRWEELIDKWGPYALTQNVEFFNQGTTVLSMLKHDGLWDKFDENGNSTLSEQETIDFALKADVIIAYIHGDYKNAIMYDKDLLMQMGMMYRRWLPMAIYRRIGKPYYNALLQRHGPALKGRWLSYGDFCRLYGQDGPVGYFKALVEITKQLGRKMIFMNTTFDKIEGLSALDAANMRKNLHEITWMIATMSLMFMLKHMSADDDDDKTKALCVFWINRLAMLEQDITFIANPSFYTNLSQNGVPMVGFLTKIGKVGLNAANVLTGGDDEYPSGVHAGKSKFWHSTMSVVPYAKTINSISDNLLMDMNKGGLGGVIEKNLMKK